MVSGKGCRQENTITICTPLSQTILINLDSGILDNQFGKFIKSVQLIRNKFVA